MGLFGQFISFKRGLYIEIWMSFHQSTKQRAGTASLTQVHRRTQTHAQEILYSAGSQSIFKKYSTTWPASPGNSLPTPALIVRVWQNVSLFFFLINQECPREWSLLTSLKTFKAFSVYLQTHKLGQVFCFL